jgi:hypothetical protein
MTGYMIAVWRSVGDEFIRIGDIVAETTGNKLRGAFRYHSTYLERIDASPVDPISLPLQQNSFTLSGALV